MWIFLHLVFSGDTHTTLFPFSLFVYHFSLFFSHTESHILFNRLSTTFCKKQGRDIISSVQTTTSIGILRVFASIFSFCLILRNILLWVNIACYWLVWCHSNFTITATPCITRNRINYGCQIWLNWNQWWNSRSYMDHTIGTIFAHNSCHHSENLNYRSLRAPSTIWCATFKK